MTTTEIGGDPHTVRARARLGMVLQDKWRLDSLLGIGGMAAVYAATHRNGKRVAIKMLHAEFSHDDDVRTRFLREGYAANTIQHEGAVSVLDDDLAPDGSAFLVMELLDGETVEQRWERSGRRLPIVEVLSLVDQLLDVLATAHDKNVVHRDIKPENLLVTRSGTLKVLDFGIAKMFETQPSRASTRTGIVMGTPAFMAPEQARARWAEVDGRTDLWAVGATMFTLLSGRHVHAADSSHDQLILSATRGAPSISTVVPEVTEEVTAIIDQALAFDRSQRWADARTMRAAVRAALEKAGAHPPLATALGAPGAAPPPPLERQPSTDRTLRSDAAATPSTTSRRIAWTAEKEARTRERERLRANMGELEQRYAAAKKAASEARSRVDEGRLERKNLEQWFHRRVGTRAAAVDETLRDVRARQVAIAKLAIVDKHGFGPEADTLRERIAKLERVASLASRDVTVHEAALRVHDARALRKGVTALLLLGLFAMALLAAPIAWRAFRVVDPPPPTPASDVPPAPAPANGLPGKR
ncbi:MAG TPA: serine/threonine-protein kinase [Polyangiaceae bacterium]|nr:serine/threonine-protein kinase [Polyangiaceae bacterium]